MINRYVKSVLLSVPLSRFFYSWLKRKYVEHQFKQRCKQLRMVGYDCLKKIDISFFEHNLPYFVDYGTLLGAVREHGFILHDDDIDITIPVGAPAWNKYFAVLSSMPEMTFKWAFVYHGKVRCLTYEHHGIYVDFAFNYLENDCKIAYLFFENPVGSKLRWRTLRLVRRYDDGVIKLPSGGIVVCAPRAYERVLTDQYGDWKKPVDYHKKDRYHKQRNSDPTSKMPMVEQSDSGEMVDRQYLETLC